MPGAAGFQLSNPSALDLTAVIASLEIFALTSMVAIRNKSISLTGYLEDLLLHAPAAAGFDESGLPYQVVTPSNSGERGAQLSLLLKPGLLEGVMKALEDVGVVVDERKPNVIRIAPAPLYNTFTEVWDFVHIFVAACLKAQMGQTDGSQEVIAFRGQKEKGWAQIK
jgi:kynureninase